MLKTVKMKNIIMRIYFLLFTISILSFLDINLSYAQTDINRDVNLPTIMPVSPEAAALGKFGQIPVNNYRGLANITVPLFKITEGMIELPIELNYHSGAIKVEEMASYVGLSWALNAGGVITRTQKGMPDEDGYFTSYNSVRNFLLGGMNSSQEEQFKINLFKRLFDAEPDMFYFNFAGFSGKFFCADNGELYTSPRSDLKVSFDNSGFKITDGKGMIYHFTAKEVTTSEPFVNLTNNDQHVAVTAWYLTSIQDPLGNTITIKYKPGGTGFRTKSVSTFNLSLSGVEMGCTDYFTDSYNQVSISRPTIEEIIFSNGKLRFNYSSTKRLDAADTAMQQITLLNPQNDTIKYYKLYTGYYTPNYDTGGCEDEYGYRLRLDSVQEFGINGKKANPYKFIYNSESMPCRMSNAQDHWGYYNGKNNLQFVRYQNALNGPWIGADKELDTAKAKTGLMVKMIYPTGGRTEFTYEGNEYSYEVPEGFDYDRPELLSELSGNNNISGGSYIVDFQTTFSVGSSDISSEGYLLAKTSLTTACSDPLLLNIFTMRVVGSNGYFKIISEGDSLHLPVGNYTITGTIETEYAGVPLCEFNLKLYEIPYNPITVYNALYGGIRIASIQNFNNDNLITDLKRFKYTYIDKPGFPGYASSGEFSAKPENMHYKYSFTNCPPASATCCNYIIYNSVSNYPLLFSGGNPIGYKNVTIFSGPDGISDKQEFTYTSFSDYPDQVSYTMPFYFASEYDWRKGVLLKKTDYKFSNGNYIPVQKVINSYDFHFSDTTRKISRAVVLGKTIQSSNLEDNAILLGLQVASYDVIAEAFNISSDTTHIFHADNIGDKTLTLINNYIYNPKNFQLSRKTSQKSNTELSIESHKYPLDYMATNTGKGKSIYNLQQKNIISIPIESVASKVAGSNESVMFGRLSSFRTDLPLVDTVFVLQSPEGIPVNQFTSSNIDVNNKFVFDPAYESRIIYTKYTGKGKTSEVSKNNDVQNCYLWDYNGELVVAAAVGADSSDIAYTSFESDGKGNWTYSGVPLINADAPTGKRTYSVSNGNLNKTGLKPEYTYKVFYWHKTGSGSVLVNGGAGVTVTTRLGWNLMEHNISGINSVAVTGSGQIDELRLYPAFAEMITYTHDPLIGITSQNSANNQISYYEYDHLNRLHLIKDDEGNILKRICYNYAGQVEDCGIGLNTNAQWVSTGLTRCQPCPANNSYTSNIQEHQERDDNPHSPTYNTYRWISDGVNSNCTPAADWQNTVTAIRCKKDGSNQNTGEQEREQRDMNPCSPNYNQVRWVVTDTNQTACPIPYVCTTGNCWLEGYKCVFGNCELGVRVCVSSSYDFLSGLYENTYRYEWSDGSWSGNFVETAHFACAFTEM